MLSPDEARTASQALIARLGAARPLLDRLGARLGAARERLDRARLDGGRFLLHACRTVAFRLRAGGEAWRARAFVPHAAGDRLRPWLRSAFVASVLWALALHEIRTSTIQASLLSMWAERLSWSVEHGPSKRIVFPKAGPFDEQRGYTELPRFARLLDRHGFRLVEQARFSRPLAFLAQWNVTPPYDEAAAVGLVVRGADGSTLYDSSPVQWQFSGYDDIPPLVVRTLVFMENRELQAFAGPRANPTVDWGRFGKAMVLYVGEKLGLPWRIEGGSTLAVQLEKYRHAEDGRTYSAPDKLRQILAASLKAYRNGPDTRAERRRIILDYVNSMPLAAAPGVGEVQGLGSGLHAWFGVDPRASMTVLATPGVTDRKARAYKRALALLYSVRAPTEYLLRDRAGLERHVDQYTRLLEAVGVLDRDLAERVRGAELRFTLTPSDPGRRSAPVDPKAPNLVRNELRELLGVRDNYELDRLHLTVESTLDAGLQAEVARTLRRLRDPEFVEKNGLHAERLLAEGDPARVVYSLLLLESTPAGNLVRVQTDNLRGAFDLNRGMKIELGSTAKVRTLAHYLELVAALHGQLAPLAPDSLAAEAVRARDEITRWAAQTMHAEPGMTIDTLLARALDRTYPAHPWEEFYTSGGVHTFQNFDDADDRRILTVREATERSTNLVYIRLMRDLVRYHEARLAYDVDAVLADVSHPQRRPMLEEAAAEETRQILARAYRDFRGLPPHGIYEQLFGTDEAGLRRNLALLFFAGHPRASEAALGAWLSHEMGDDSPEMVREIHQEYSNPRFGLLDYAYLLDRHPLRVWCAAELLRDSTLNLRQILARSRRAREASVRWLLDDRHKKAQDLRLRASIEREAFERMTPYWRRLGFPFQQLVPSLATAIGSSSDRPAALADLMGILVNDGVRRDELVVQRLSFGPETPYHSVFAADPPGKTRVMAAPVARALRQVLARVVEAGTARRIQGAFLAPDSTPLPIGGKTGSGDNRLDSFDRRGRTIASRPVSRTATFVFYIGRRHFGVITASVLGRRADEYSFTSSLPLAVLRLLAPAIQRSITPGFPGQDEGLVTRSRSAPAEGERAVQRMLARPPRVTSSERITEPI
jgi:membrane peptidoglycan carboxypeptidase